jgi:uncharacterized membrane protein YbhN (UPF0104 family)
MEKSQVNAGPRKKPMPKALMMATHRLQAAVRRSPGLRVAAQVAVVALCLVPLVRQAAADWPAIRTVALKLWTPALFAAIAGLGAASLLLPLAMSAFTRGAKQRIPMRDSALAYFASQPMKYLPGSFWILPGRVVLLRRMGHDVSLSSAALLFEMVTHTISCALVAAVALTITGLGSPVYRDAAWLIFGGSLAAGLALVASPALVGRLLRRNAGIRQAMAQLAQVPVSARMGNLLLTVMGYAVMWLVMGASLYFVVIAAGPKRDLGLLGVSIAAFALSWLAGFLTPISPGGIGVREGITVLLLTPFLGAAVAVTVALLARVLVTVVEMGFAAAAWLPIRKANQA